MNNTVEFEDIRIKLPELRTWFRDQEIFPTLAELKLLMVLMSAPCEIFSTDELVMRLDLPSTQSLHVMIAHLREKLDQQYIITMRGHGYAFARESYSQKAKES